MCATHQRTKTLRVLDFRYGSSNMDIRGHSVNARPTLSRNVGVAGSVLPTSQATLSRATDIVSCTSTGPPRQLSASGFQLWSRTDIKLRYGVSIESDKTTMRLGTISKTMKHIKPRHTKTDSFQNMFNTLEDGLATRRQMDMAAPVQRFRP